MNQGVFKVNLRLFDRQQFLVGAKSHFGEDNHEVLEIAGSDKLNSGLFTCCRIVRFSYTISDGNGKLDSRARVYCKPPLSDRKVEDQVKDAVIDSYAYLLAVPLSFSLGELSLQLFHSGQVVPQVLGKSFSRQYSETPTGLRMSRRAYSAAILFPALHRIMPILG